MQATSLLLRLMQSSSKLYYDASKKVLRYLKGTSSYSIWYTNITDL